MIKEHAALWYIVFVVTFVITTYTCNIMYINYAEYEECRLMKDSGFETKLLDYKMVMKQCYVKDNNMNKYIPYEKFRAIGE